MDTILQTIVSVSVLLAMIGVHELGHAFFAKREGIFVGFEISGGSPGVLMSAPHRSRWTYLAGMGFELGLLPAFLYVSEFSWLFFGVFMALLLGGGVIDILLVIKYPQLVKDFKEGKPTPHLSRLSD